MCRETVAFEIHERMRSGKIRQIEPIAVEVENQRILLLQRIGMVGSERRLLRSVVIGRRWRLLSGGGAFCRIEMIVKLIGIGNRPIREVGKLIVFANDGSLRAPGRECSLYRVVDRRQSYDAGAIYDRLHRSVIVIPRALKNGLGAAASALFVEWRIDRREIEPKLPFPIVLDGDDKVAVCRSDRDEELVDGFDPGEHREKFAEFRPGI